MEVKDDGTSYANRIRFIPEHPASKIPMVKSKLVMNGIDELRFIPEHPASKIPMMNNKLVIKWNR